MTARLRFLFAGVFHWNAGSSHMIAEYARAASAAGCEVGVSTQLSRLDGAVDEHLPLVDDVGWATHLVLVFEGAQFLSARQRELCEDVPRHRRFVIDPDGHWGPHVQAGADDNAAPYSLDSWHELYAGLSDVILQPRIGSSLPEGAEFFSYFGMPPIHRRGSDQPGSDRLPYELQYVGANWWRWDSFARLVRAAEEARPEIKRIRVCGRWWAGEPHPRHPVATANRPGWLEKHGVEVLPPVPFGQVVQRMADSAITPVLARPLLARIGLLTPRMFETPASGSLPVLPPELTYAMALYGDEATPFLLGGDPGDTLARMLRAPEAYRRGLAAIQHRLHQRFNYTRVLAELVRFAQ